MFPEDNANEAEIEKRSQVGPQIIIAIIQTTNIQTRVILFAKLVALELWTYGLLTGKGTTFARSGTTCAMLAQDLARALRSPALLAMPSSFATTTVTRFRLGAPTSLITSTTSSQLALGQSTAPLALSGLALLLGLFRWSEGNNSILTTTMSLLRKTLANLFVVYVMRAHVMMNALLRR